MAVAMEEKSSVKSTSHVDEKSLKKKALLTVEDLKYARKLADNDSQIRKRALKWLQNYLTIRSKSCPWEEENLQILWKGLFYSMWMSDKPLVQEECAESISKLIHSFTRLNEKMMFFKAGLTILQNEWIGIDQHRYDKFLMFVRRVLRQAFVVLNGLKFKKKFNKEFTDVLEATLLNVDKNSPIGLFMHFTEIYLEELAKVSNGNIVLKTRLLDLLLPFIAKLAYSTESREISWISKFIFVYLIKQHDLGLEYREKYNAWKSMGFPGTINQIQKVMPTDNAEENSDESDEQNNAASGLLNGSQVMDPRAGRVNVELPQILFQENEIAEALLSFTTDKRTSTKSRNVLISQAQNFKKLAKGAYPLGIKSIELGKQKNSENVDMNVTKAAKRLIKFEQKLLGKDKAKKKRKNSDSEDSIPNKKKKMENANDTESLKLNKREKRYLKKLTSVARQNSTELSSEGQNNENGKFEKTQNSFHAEEGNKKKNFGRDRKNSEDLTASNKNSEKLMENSKHQINAIDSKTKIIAQTCTKEIPNNKARVEAKKADLRKRMLKKKVEQPKKVQPSEVPNSLDDDISIECLFRRNSGVWFVTEEQPTLPKVQSADQLKSLDLRPSLAGAEESTLHKQNMSPNKSGIHVSSRKSLMNQKPLPAEINSDATTPLKLIPIELSKSTIPKNPKLESNMADFLLADPRFQQTKRNSIYKNLLSNPLPKSSNLRGKSKASLNNLSRKTPLQKLTQIRRAVTTPSGTKFKKVRINTSLNVSQEIHEHISQVFSSPMIPYDRNKRPAKPVLKTPVKGRLINGHKKQSRSTADSRLKTEDLIT